MDDTEYYFNISEIAGIESMIFMKIRFVGDTRIGIIQRIIKNAEGKLVGFADQMYYNAYRVMGIVKHDVHPADLCANLEIGDFFIPRAGTIYLDITEIDEKWKPIIAEKLLLR